MTGPAPIPPDEFETALDALDSDDLVAFVADLWAATADEVAVDSPRVTVRDGDARTDLVVVRAASETERGGFDAVDANAADANANADGDAVAVVLGEEDPDAVDDPDPEVLDVETVTAGDLRRRLLYALPAADADSVSERFLGTAARSESYPRDLPTEAETEPSTGREEPAAETEKPSTERESPAAETGGAATATRPPTATESTETPPTGETGSPALGSGSSPSRSGSRPGVPAGRTIPDDAAGGSNDGTNASAGDGFAAEGSDGRLTASRGDDRDASRNRVAVAVVVVVLLAAVGGAASLAGPSLTDGVGDRLDPGDDSTASGEGPVDGSEEPDASGDSSASASSENGPGGSADMGDSGAYTGVIDPGGSIELAGGDGNETDRNGTAAARATALEPTCERAPLHVVQIQMNALRYNDPATNDGIRTTRRFASPQNRRAVSTFPQFVDLFEGPNYAPMLNHDAALYAPLGIDGDRATVRVVTYENGSATGHYEFRMRKVDASDASLTGYGGGYGGCWMTDAVGVVSADDPDGGSDDGDSNGTADASGDAGTTEGTDVHGPPGN
ncbi:hypothetical protein [Halorubrum aethiopicum]|uniref:hypothetical protein n=1 Tax=Halorubrum aethiopicum TaxID=1758255 RepID=UPI000836E31E|nr:hypothetical protein [Halorubrum aethiopicum]